MSRVIVCYRVKPDRAHENDALVRVVYDVLHETRPAGLRCAMLKLDDGVSFVHIAEHDDGAPNRLTRLPAFKRFRADIRDRCDEPW
jgi:hypothetical protein